MPAAWPAIVHHSVSDATTASSPAGDTGWSGGTAEDGVEVAARALAALATRNDVTVTRRHGVTASSRCHGVVTA